jgi:hypothetical protein
VVKWCCMCKKNGESVDHLLIHCEVATCFMALCIHFVRCGVGDAAKGHRFVCLLESGGVGGIYLELFGGWLRCASYGAYGGRGMHGSLRITNVRWMG